MKKYILIIASACILLYSCDNKQQQKETSKEVEPLYTFKDTMNIVSAIFAYQDSTGENINSILDQSPLDTIAFIKNEHYNSPIFIPTRKVITYIPPPDWYPRLDGRADQFDLFFTGFRIYPDSASCGIMTKNLNSILIYELKKNKKGNWHVDKYIEGRM